MLVGSFQKSVSRTICGELHCATPRADDHRDDHLKLQPDSECDHSQKAAVQSARHLPQALRRFRMEGE
jgi:hypothetical protein